MTVRLELKPEVEAALADQAKGVPLEACLQNAVEDLAHTRVAPKRNVERFRTALDRLAEMGRDLPHLLSSAFTRERIYRGHD